ncbi:MAG: TRM11 family SAM-dependent methyltransferase [Candidatus Woesearchaeota archaeon]
MKQKHVKITGNNIDFYLLKNHVILFSIRSSRLKAKKLAIMEAYFALSILNPIFIKNGPLGDLKGVFSFFVEKDRTDKLRDILHKIGYCNKFYILDFDTDTLENLSDMSIKSKLIWKGKKFSIRNFFIQDESIYKNQSPDKRKFIIKDSQNQEKKIYGYRGDGREFSRRALPVEDARCLVNLSDYNFSNRLLDPFAGGGGIVYQAKYINKKKEVYSIDIDPTLAPGLLYYGSNHYTNDSSHISFEDDFFDSIVTEVPFSSNATVKIIKSIKNLHNSINMNGSLVIMSNREQSLSIKEYVNHLGYHQYMSQKINRKGTGVVIMAWYKSYMKYKKIKGLLDVVEKIL